MYRFHHSAAVPGELPINKVSRLNAVSALVDRRNSHIAKELRCTGLLDITHTAVNLHAERGDLLAHLGHPALNHWNHEIEA